MAFGACYVLLGSQPDPPALDVEIWGVDQTAVAGWLETTLAAMH